MVQTYLTFWENQRTSTIQEGKHTTNFYQPAMCKDCFTFSASVCLLVCMCVHTYHMHHNYVTYIVAIMADLTAALSANVAIYE